LEGTRWAAERRDHRAGAVPRVEYDAHRTVCSLVAQLVAPQVAGDGEPVLVHAAHDVSGGGLALALAEMAAVAGTGAVLDVAEASELFTELPSRFVLATPDPDRLRARADAVGVPTAVLGRAGGDRLTLGAFADLEVNALRGAYEGSLARALGDT
jgi:phosphoribosylformylglycinamidine synthase